MATFYGDWKYRRDGYGQRLILDISRDGATIWFNLKLESNGSMYATVPYNWSGRISGGSTVSIAKSQAFVESISSGSFVERNSFLTSATVNMFWGGVLTVSANLPAQEVIPSPPSAFRFEQSITDREAGQGVLKWTPGANSTYTRLTVAYNGESFSPLGYSSSGQLSVQRMMPDSYYYFTAVAGNSTGESSAVPLGTGGTYAKFFTKPAAPSNVVVYPKTSNSVGIKYRVNARHKHGLRFESSTGQYWTLGDGVASTVPSETTLTVPANADMRFRVQSYVGNENERIYSEWSEWSDSVSVLSIPNAPTRITPDGGLHNNSSGYPIHVSWQHNPTDSTPQSQWRLRYRAKGSVDWSIPAVYTGSVSEATLPLSLWNQIRTLTRVEIQLSTMGGLTGAWSPWSATASFNLAPPPGVRILKPLRGTPSSNLYRSNRLAVEWSTLSSYTQTGWKARYRKASEADWLETKEGEGEETSIVFDTSLQDNTTYYAEVLTRISANIWSTSGALVVFTVKFLPPGAPAVSGSRFDGSIGSASFTVTKGNNTERVIVEKSLDGGHTYTPLIEQEANQFSVTDFECLIGGITRYRVTAISPEGSETSITHEVSSVSNPEAPSLALGKCGSYLSTGANFEKILAFPYKVTRSRKVGRKRASVHYRGRKHPTPYISGQLTDTMVVSGLIKTGRYAEGVTEQQLVDLVNEPFAIFLWRDSEGHHFYCSVGEMTIDRDSPNISTWSIELTRVQYDGRGNIAGLI